jgi:CheY-like chemotaxis protein/HPt (histidine-containing phosphotransfer) domain-containing protein
MKHGEIEIILEVIDTGIGIEESKIDSIFDDFTQEEMSTTRKYGGTGLGLSIVKKLVDLHDGVIECTSRKNVGTHITCHLPYNKGEEKHIRNELVPLLYIPDEISKLKILIVDDEEYNRLLFKSILTRWNIKFSEAKDGMEAVEMVKNNHFDLLFMDARMPGTDGLKATQIIREGLGKKSSELPVICISAASLNDDWEKYEKAGMNAFLEKPFTEEMLLTTILTVIRDISEAEAGTETFIEDSNGGNENKNSNDINDRINLQNLFHIAGGDTQFAKQMLVTYLETTTKGLREMNDAAASGQWNTVAELAHKLLPPSRHIGASGISNFLRKIEESIKSNGDSGTIKDLADDTLREFELIRDLLNEQITKIN